MMMMMMMRLSSSKRRTDYWLQESNVYFITFDLEKTLPLPKLAVSIAFYLRQLWVYNMGVHLVSKEKNGPYFNVWTEDQAGRGVREVTSSLLAFLQTSQVSGGTLIAWSDSCSGQNKNFLMICFWQNLIAKGIFESIHHKFPEPGHNFLDSDRDFGSIEVSVKRRESIYSLDEYCDIMMSSANKPRPNLNRMGDKMFEIGKLPLMLGLRKVDVNVQGDKVELRDKVKWIKILKFGYFQYKHSFDDNESWKEVCILKACHPSIQPVNEPEVSVSPVVHRVIKKAETDDTKKQLKFIPKLFQGYYQNVIQKNEASVNEQPSISDNDQCYSPDEIIGSRHSREKSQVILRSKTTESRSQSSSRPDCKFSLDHFPVNHLSREFCFPSFSDLTTFYGILTLLCFVFHSR